MIKFKCVTDVLWMYYVVCHHPEMKDTVVCVCVCVCVCGRGCSCACACVINALVHIGTCRWNSCQVDIYQVQQY